MIDIDELTKRVKGIEEFIKDLDDDNYLRVMRAVDNLRDEPTGIQAVTSRRSLQRTLSKPEPPIGEAFK